VPDTGDESPGDRLRERVADLSQAVVHVRAVGSREQHGRAVAVPANQGNRLGQPSFSSMRLGESNQKIVLRERVACSGIARPRSSLNDPEPILPGPIVDGEASLNRRLDPLRRISRQFGVGPTTRRAASPVPSGSCGCGSWRR
jgi:hypothetical protein